MDYSRDHYIYQTNACALSSILENPNPEYYNNSYECQNYNICSGKTKEKCVKNMINSQMMIS